MTGLYRRMVKDMQLRGFSERTQETYLREVRKLAEHVEKSPGKITEEELREYFLHLKNEHAFSASSMKVAYCGVKFFFTFTLKKKWGTLALVRARYVPLPNSTLRGLRAYWKTHRNPVWLFPFLGNARNQGPTATRPMNSKSLQGALRRVVTGLGFKKRVTMHTLRHSYATHLLEAGVGLRLLQQYLGHKSMATTYVYCHLTKMGHDAARDAIDRLMDRKGDGNGDAR